MSAPPPPVEIPIPQPSQSNTGSIQPNPSRQPNKLRKKPSQAFLARQAETPILDSSANAGPAAVALSNDDEKKNRGWLSSLKGKHKAIATDDGIKAVRFGNEDVLPEGLSVEMPGPTTAHLTPGPVNVDGADWKHHERYFPLWTEADFAYSAPTTSNISSSGIVSSSSSSPYTFKSPFDDALTVVEAQALEHAKLSGRDIAVNYPALPVFDDFLKGKSRESVGWKEAQWGTEGWTGYGWDGEKLPDKDGVTFGKEMPKGKVAGGEDDKEKGKKK